MRILSLLFFLLWAGSAEAKTGSVLACHDPLVPPYAAPGAPPNIAIWTKDEPDAAMAASGCPVWKAWRSDLVVALAGSFPYDGSASGLLARFGAISAFRGIRYWSVTDGRWQTLISAAIALDGPDRDRPRGDFSPAEMERGQPLYFEEKDNRSSRPVVYEESLRELRDDRFVLEVENVSAVRLFLLPLFAPGDLQSLYLLERLAPGVWGFYSLAGVRQGPFGGGPGSYVNRAVAVYRHILGIPTDQDPPAWR
ncbi:MAG TPA: DUF6675 family protein [Dongiaceae bacterium]|nr:DUF6675 family protein [Dongiaceae bacterium]